MKSTIRDAGIYLVLGIGCIVGAGYVSDSVWHDSLLVIGGILVGGFCAMVALIQKIHREDKETVGPD